MLFQDPRTKKVKVRDSKCGMRNAEWSEGNLSEAGTEGINAELIKQSINKKSYTINYHSLDIVSTIQISFLTSLINLRGYQFIILKILKYEKPSLSIFLIKL